jgi:hypothetical protein
MRSAPGDGASGAAEGSVIALVPLCYQRHWRASDAATRWALRAHDRAYRSQKPLDSIDGAGPMPPPPNPVRLGAPGARQSRRGEVALATDSAGLG